jgi:hypothetical protein
MSGIYVDVPDITVFVGQEGETKLTLSQTYPDIKVIIRQEGETKVALTQPDVTAIITGSFSSFAETSTSASFATTASYAINAGNGSGTARFIRPTERYTVKSSQQAYIYDMYIYGTLDIESGSMTLPFGNTTISNHGTLIFTDHIYNMGIIENKGIIQLL